MVARCHGKTHTKEIDSQSGVGKERTDVFFEDPRMQSLKGVNTKRLVATGDHEMSELDGRLKSTGLGRLGIGGQVIWNRKR